MLLESLVVFDPLFISGRVAAMHDPFAWSLNVGRLFGVQVRIHWLFPFVVIGSILHIALYKPHPGYEVPNGIWIDACIYMLILFFSVLFHELGHCFAARACGGEAREVLLWPLGGLANVDVPNRPSAHFWTAAAGPITNLFLCLLSGLALAFVAEYALQPTFNPMPTAFPWRDMEGKVELYSWGGEKLLFSSYSLVVWLARIFWVNWFLALLNLILVGFPLDGGRMLQAALWPSLGYRQSMLTAVFAGFAIALVVALYAIVQNTTLALCLALFIYVTCHRQMILLETGGEEGIFGYDFSQGYTSLERDQIQAPARPKVGWWKRWMQQRAARKMQKEIERRDAEEKRMDELLEKITQHGRSSLTDEEERFLKRVGDRFKNRD
jgi:Zn-dependent protease